MYTHKLWKTNLHILIVCSIIKGMKSKLFTLNVRDFLRGLVVAILASVFAWVLQVLNAPGFDWATINWAELARIALSSCIGYLMKNYISNSRGEVLGIQ